MPYRDPEKKREWERTHRAERSKKELDRLHAERDRQRLEEITRLAYETPEEAQRKNAAYDNETSYKLSLSAERRRRFR